ncbi:MAG: helix-turn-helix domain-containing protein [Candidatus Paceibacterota bacterium]
MKNIIKDKFKTFDLLTIAITTHLFAVQSKLLFHLNPDSREKDVFSFLELNEQTVIAMILSLAYALATFSILRSSNKLWLIAVFALLDSVGVLFYYNIKIPLQSSAIYFAIYTGTIIISIAFLKRPEYLADQILELKKKGLNQREIAKRLGVTESKVSRVKSRVNGVGE